jgi:hypothetical protein
MVAAPVAMVALRRDKMYMSDEIELMDCLWRPDRTGSSSLERRTQLAENSSLVVLCETNRYY